MLSLYPAIEPFKHYFLSVANAAITNEDATQTHQLYVEQCGNPAGIPVVFLHGGPGSGCRPSHRCFFDPALYHIILFDQRGCGRSRPQGLLAENTTAHLVEDIELIRQHLAIDKWLVFGGSWGATLALCYAQKFAERVTGLILRGVFLARQQDIDWFYREKGAAKIYPDAWQHLVEHLPVSQQAQPLSAIYQQLLSDNSQVSNAMLNKIQHWEANLVYWQKWLTPDEVSATEDDKVPAIIQLYYSMNQCFIEHTPILEHVDKVRHIPTTIIHGRNDMVCPVEQAWLLKQRWPEAQLSIIEMAGHVASEPKIIAALVKTTDNFAKRK
ncbi:prolyl aminopeptidase [Colwellia sp. PAMC 21821]|uniref:prolyl aminopeptidase n=1 Tax=Colwellia sp. PAMC 21821 TaxID=1816219 RepID=UPI0009BFE61A|nr:prolyl aminopeptidase [Colwellia sp. PAMC 21821]ARD43054.1 prolyl aminopeptidase [Colwellia sp. PAMC 21821]